MLHLLAGGLRESKEALIVLAVWGIFLRCWNLLETLLTRGE